MRVTGGKLRLVPGLDEGGVGGGGDLHGGRRLGERHAAVRRDREPALRRQAAAGRLSVLSWYSPQAPRCARDCAFLRRRSVEKKTFDVMQGALAMHDGMDES